jgi:S1-C subfamily serine protease
MKLYSRGQVIFFSVLSVIIAVLAMTIFDSLKDSIVKSDEQIAEIPEIIELEQFDSSQLQINANELQPYTENERENIIVYERLNPAVVNITTETVAINWFLEPVPQRGGSGSGSIIDTRGYVLTNNHVIANAHKVFINLADGSQFEGTIVGTDPENDLAVIKFDPPRGKEIRTVPFGDSSNLKEEKKVLALHGACLL